jgi:hypothetical protein
MGSGTSRDTNLVDCFNAGGNSTNGSSDAVGFLQIELAPFVSLFPRFNML